MRVPVGRLRTIPFQLMSLAVLGACGGGGGSGVDPVVEAAEVGESLDGPSPGRSP